MQRRRCVVVRQGHLIEIRVLIAVVEAFLIAVVVVGCGGSGPGNIDGRDGERGAAATNEETTAPEGDRPATGTAREPAGLDVKVVTPGQAYVPAGFGEGSLWATDLATCNDTGSASTSAGSASSSAAACALPAKTLLKKLDPQTGEVVAKIEVGRGAVDIAVDESSGAVWVAGLDLSEDYVEYDPPKYSEDRKLSRVDPATNRVVAEIPIRAGSPDGGAQSVAVGKSEVWAQSVDGRLFKVNPATNEVAAMVSLGEWSSHLAVFGGAVWATFQAYSAGTGEQLVRVDPRTEHVVASEDIGPVSRVGYGRLVAGGGYVWFASRGGLARVAL
jgi:DNA-binding beta-propeller fold protein YncE